jgi:hypothetical protein
LIKTKLTVGNLNNKKTSADHVKSGEENKK